MPKEIAETNSLEHEELRGIARTVAEIEWLLLILVLLYMTFDGLAVDNHTAVSMALFFYAAFIMSFRYANFYKSESRWKIAIESLGMIAFITWTLWFTGRLESPLLNTYLLVIITSSLTLEKVTTLVELCLIASCLFLLGINSATSHDLFSLGYVGGIVAQFVPFLLVAYITTMFSSDIRYGINKAKLISETDELTELLNRRGFAIAGDRLIGQAARYDRPLSILMIDSDNLKPVNDSYGHNAGDRLLTLLVKCIQLQLRDTDIIARYGGDEFVVLLPETPDLGALEVAERIRISVSNTLLEIDGRVVKMSVSIGVSTYPADGRKLDSLVANADEAMYRAKKAGRDQVVKYVA
jgi:diguanylate cyclase (GGDEF)-like protein